jgi:hypothetical protein
MTIRQSVILLTVVFSLLPLVLPAQQAAVEDSAKSTDRVSLEAVAVLELVKNLDDR